MSLSLCFPIRYAKIDTIPSPTTMHDQHISPITAYGGMPLPGFVTALQTWSQPQSPEWFAYYSGQEHARTVVAQSLTAQFGRSYAPEDIFMTNGAFGALAVVLDAPLPAPPSAVQRPDANPSSRPHL